MTGVLNKDVDKCGNSLLTAGTAWRGEAAPSPSSPPDSAGPSFVKHEKEIKCE